MSHKLKPFPQNKAFTVPSYKNRAAMLNSFVKSSRTAAATTLARVFRLGPTSSLGNPSPPQSRFIHDTIARPNANPVALQMIDYALSLAKSQHSDEACAQGMLVLEQCLSSQSIQDQDIVTHNSQGIVLLAMSNLLYARGDYGNAMEKLSAVQELTHSSRDVKVAAVEALAGINLEMGNGDTSSVIVEKCLEHVGEDDVVDARAKAIKGLIELVHGNFESAKSLFQGFDNNEGHHGNASLSYGEFLHATQSYQLAKDSYQKVVDGVVEGKDFTDIHVLAACNMSSEELLLAATCALGQLQSHMGNFGDAEETLTKALMKAEEHFGSRHPKVGTVLTCLALMFRHKAIREHSSSLLIQEGLYRRALELLKAPPVEFTSFETMNSGRDIIALARGGYGEILCVQQNRKGEGEKMKTWAESAWRNRRLSLAEALKCSESSKRYPVIDTRIGRAI